MGESGTVGEIWMEGERLKEAKEFKYLGSTVQQSGGSEVVKRIQGRMGSMEKGYRGDVRLMCTREGEGEDD